MASRNGYKLEKITLAVFILLLVFILDFLLKLIDKI